MSDPFSNPHSNPEPVKIKHRRGGAALSVIAALLLGAAMLVFALLYRQPALQVVPGRITPAGAQGAGFSFLVAAPAGEAPAECGFALLGQEEAATAAVFSPEAEGWICTGKPPQAALPGDAAVPYALFPGVLYVGEPEPAETFAAAETGIRAQRLAASAGGFPLRLEVALAGLDPNSAYFAGFVAGADEASLQPFGDAVQISGAESYTLTAEDTLAAQPVVCAAYLYPLGGNTVIIADQARFTAAELEAVQPSPAPAAATTAPTPTRTPAATPTPTASPVPTAAPTPASANRKFGAAEITPTPAAVTTPTASPVPTAAPTQAGAQITSAHPYFDLYDIGTRYYFHQLSDHEKAVFAALYDGAMAFEPEIAIPVCTEEELDRAIFVLHYDCPELFQLAYAYNEAYRGQDEFISVSPEYLTDAAQYETDMENLLQAVSQMQYAPDFGTTDPSRELSVYRAIIAGSTYSLTLPFCDRAYGPLLLGYGKCDGYSKALSFSLRYYGIPCTEVCGDAVETQDIAGPAEHSWNYVSVGGQWYQCDITWDDGASPESDPQPDFLPFFNLTDARMLLSHTIWPMFTAWKLPVCDSTEAYYYGNHAVSVRRGGDFTVALDGGLTGAYQSDAAAIPFLFDTAQDYQSAVDALQADTRNWRYSGAQLRGFAYLSSDEGLALYLFDLKYYP